MVRPENLVLLEHFIGKYNEIMEIFITGSNQGTAGLAPTGLATNTADTCAFKL